MATATAPAPSTSPTTQPPPAKRPCTRPVLCTHSGAFHADEALAIHMLRTLPEYRDAAVVRSRDPAVWAGATVLVDVGAQYDPAMHKYDHHQREFVDTFSPAHATRLSSAGLVYKHFGRRVIATLLGRPSDDDADTDPAVATVHLRLYDDLIEAFDAIDNGVPRYPRDVTPRYRDATSLSAVVAKLNPFWNEPDANPDARFEDAVRLVGAHFDRCVRYLGTAWLPARGAVQQALAQRHGGGDMGQDQTLAPETARARGHIIVMDEYVPWKDHLRDCELADASLAQLECAAPLAEGMPVPAGLPLYVVFPDPSGTWRVQAIPLQPDSFESRKPLPHAWRGLRDAQLDGVTHVPGGVFIHASGFIGGHATRDGAVRLAELAVAM